MCVGLLYTFVVCVLMFVVAYLVDFLSRLNIDVCSPLRVPSAVVASTTQLQCESDTTVQDEAASLLRF